MADPGHFFRPVTAELLTGGVVDHVGESVPLELLQDRGDERQDAEAGGHDVELAGGEHRPGVWSIEAALIDFARGRGALSVNGAEVAASDTFLTPGLTSPTDSLMFRIGNDHDNGFWQGDLAELLIFDRALTSAERQSIESYLSRKYIVP